MASDALQEPATSEEGGSGGGGAAIGMEGELYIRLHRRKRRYCLLRGQWIQVYNSKASFRENPAQPVLRIKVEGVGPWAGIHVVNPSRSPSETGFLVINGNPDWFSPRKVYVYADTAAERDQWLTAIKKALREVAEGEGENRESGSSNDSWSHLSSDGDDGDQALTEEEFLAALYPAGEVYQNQTYGLTGWKSTNIRWHGRAKFSNADGTISTPWLNLEGWQIERNRFPCDKDGWQYATSFDGKESPITFIRRRLWLQKQVAPRSNLWEVEKEAERSSLVRTSIVKGEGDAGDLRASDLDSESEPENEALEDIAETERMYNAFLLEDTEQTVGYLVENIVRQYMDEMGVIRRRNVHTVLPQVVEPFLRQIVEFEGQEYGESHKQQLEEMVEEYSRKMKRRYSQGQNVQWVLREILSKLIKSNIHKEETIMRLRALYSTTVSLYVNKEEGAEKQILKVPRLRIVIIVVGSRGDVQPFIALGKGLASKGHLVRVATHEVFRDFVTGHGLDFFPLAGDPKMLMEAMVNHKLISVGMVLDHLRSKRPWMKELFKTVYQACTTPSEGDEFYRADALIANPPSLCAPHVAEKLGIPLHMAFTMPWTPTRAVQSPFITTELTSDAAKYLSYLTVDLAIWSGIRDLVQEWRRKTLRLRKVKRGATTLNDKQVPFTYCFSEHLLPRPSDWQPWIGVSGLWFLDNPDFDYQPPKDLLDFLAKGDQPVFIGFGSIVVKDPAKLTRLVIEAVIKSGERAIIQKGWSGLGDVEDCPQQVYMIGPAPHDWLFAQCKAVVHHGGAGTTAAGLRLGKPTGPAAVPYSSLTSDILADEIKYACSPQALTVAGEIGKAIQRESGVEKAIQQFHAHLPLKFMVCQYIGCQSEKVALVFYPTLGIRVCQQCDESIVKEAQETQEELPRYRFSYVDWTKDTPVRETGMVVRERLVGPSINYIEADEGGSLSSPELMSPEVLSEPVGGEGAAGKGGVFENFKDIVRAPFQRGPKGEGESPEDLSPSTEESPSENRTSITGFVNKFLGKNHGASGGPDPATPSSASSSVVAATSSTSSSLLQPSHDLERASRLHGEAGRGGDGGTEDTEIRPELPSAPVRTTGGGPGRKSISTFVQRIVYKKPEGDVASSSSPSVNEAGGTASLSPEASSTSISLQPCVDAAVSGKRETEGPSAGRGPLSNFVQKIIRRKSEGEISASSLTSPTVTDSRVTVASAQAVSPLSSPQETDEEGSRGGETPSSATLSSFLKKLLRRTSEGELSVSSATREEGTSRQERGEGASSLTASPLLSPSADEETMTPAANGQQPGTVIESKMSDVPLDSRSRGSVLNRVMGRLSRSNSSNSLGQKSATT